MKFRVLAADFDGTLATDGCVEAETVQALHRLRESGRKLVLVTGRIVDQLLQVFPEIGLCDLVVADNGGLLFDPLTGERTRLAPSPPPAFADEMVRRGIPGIEMGDAVIATWEPHETTVLEIIRDLGLELQIIFNKGAVMILPTGVNKATGLKAALERLGISLSETVGIGDAENDESFLKLCGASVAVENALEVVKRQVDYVTKAPRGAGACELIAELINNDLQKLPLRPRRAEAPEPLPPVADSVIVRH
jgi:hydroxymethylpyrimidine pyrophosphatase-like HAD family hydrolase